MHDQALAQERVLDVTLQGLQLERSASALPTLEATQGQIDGFFSQIPYNCHQSRVASVGG